MLRKDSGRAMKHLRRLGRAGVDAYVILEARPFRFGGGPRIMSEYAVVFPLRTAGGQRPAWIRASVVPQSVPLLLSWAVLKKLGPSWTSLAWSSGAWDEGGVDRNELETMWFPDR